MVKELEKAIEEMNINLYKVFTSVFHPLKKSYILDFGSFIYMTKDRYRLLRYKPVSQRDGLKYRRGRVVIQSYGDLDIQFINQGKKKPKML